MGNWEEILKELAESDMRHGGFIQAALDEIASLKVQLAECKKDAERYRWLRDSDNQRHEDDPSVSDSFFNQYFDDDLDNEIDRLIIRNSSISAQKEEA